MFEIEDRYWEIEKDLKLIKSYALKYADIDEELGVYMAYNNIENIIDKAKSWDILKFKQSQGGKKSAKNMSKEQRIERSKKAGSTKKKIISISI